MFQPRWTAIWQFLQMLSKILPYDPENRYARQIKICVHAKSYTGTFIVPLFIPAIKWKQPNCP